SVTTPGAWPGGCRPRTSTRRMQAHSARVAARGSGASIAPVVGPGMRMTIDAPPGRHGRRMATSRRGIDPSVPTGEVAAPGGPRRVVTLRVLAHPDARGSPGTNRWHLLYSPSTPTTGGGAGIAGDGCVAASYVQRRATVTGATGRLRPLLRQSR